ncbi:MAG: AAA family ATPase [Caldilineaceae bacterium]|nr:AAA family ATPase [Caldilineaceae bacterium]
MKWGLLPVYLAEAGKPKPRTELAHLLWPHVDVETARSDLRTLLMRERRDGLESFFHADRNFVALANPHEIDYDCAVLRAAAKDAAHAPLDVLMAAAARYRGDFLETVVLDEYPELDEWAAAVRVEMEIAAVRVLSTLVARGLETGPAEAVRPYAAQLADLAPYDDNAAELNVRTLAGTGEVAAALLYFQQYRRRLQEDMSLEVTSPSLLRLVEQISRPGVAPEILARPAAGVPVAKKPEAALAASPSPARIIGRERERARLEELLNQGARLISVTGMGGIGKTTFVRSRLHELSTRGVGPIYVIDCRGHASHAETAAATLLHAIVAGLGWERAGEGVTLFNQVCAALAGAPVCLVLDNFETLDAATPTVAQLLATLPALTVITTTIRALRLKDEAIIELHGLGTHPTGDGPSEAAAFFIERVRQERMDFTLTQTDRQLVEAICRRLGGHPLAIELAAAQADFYELEELAELVGRDGTQLAAPYQDVPAEHRSLTTLLEEMWSQLSPQARIVMARLSVFASTFSHAAMHAVAPATMDVYRDLHRTSLLQAEAESGWFSLHPLVKQYAAQRLALKGLEDETRARHSRYFLAQFDLGGHFRATSIDTASHLDPIMRTQADAFWAWENAVVRGDWELLERAGLNFAEYLFWTQQHEMTAGLLPLLLGALPPFPERTQGQQRLAGLVAAYLAIIVQFASRTDCINLYEHSLAALDAADAPLDLAAVSQEYADVMLNGGLDAASKAEPLLARARQLVETHRFTTLEPLVNTAYGMLAIYQGKWAQAQTILATTTDTLQLPANQAIYHSVMLQAGFVDDWQSLRWVLHAARTKPAGKSAEHYIAAWINYYQGHLLAHGGDIEGACRQRAAAIDINADNRYEYMFPLAYGELALWQTLTGDVTGAHVTADTALADARRTNIRFVNGFALLVVGVCHLLWGDAARAEALLREALALGLALEHAVMIFSPLYFLVQIHADKLPADLTAQITKIGAVSPAMYFALRPRAQTHLVEQGLALADAERAALWATDRDAVMALLAKVEGEIGRLGD